MKFDRQSQPVDCLPLRAATLPAFGSGAFSFQICREISSPRGGQGSASPPPGAEPDLFRSAGRE